ncbi:MAG: CvpA family protein [Thermomicrobiales bacterium]
MPQIDTPLLLDILLGLVILLFVPFGIRRGVAKEAMVSAGILLGANLANRFGDVWSAELASRFGLEAGAARFATAALALFACTFILGYGAGAALGVMRPGTLARLAGGLLAAFNAALLLSYLLGWIDQFLQQGAPLDNGILSEALLRQSSILLLAAAGVLFALTIIGWIVNAARARRQPRESDGSLLPGIPGRQRPVRVAPAADAGKYEPGLEPVSRSGRFGSGLDATSPLPASTPADYSGRGPWPGEAHATVVNNGHSGGSQADTAGQTQGDDTIWSAWSAPANDNALARTEPASQWPVAAGRGVTDDGRCPVCRARVGARDVFCPDCGATL